MRLTEGEYEEFRARRSLRLIRKGVLVFYLWEFTDAHETEYEPTNHGSYNFRFHRNACHDCSRRIRIGNFSLHRRSGFACTMAAEHNHVVGKERSRFCDYLRKGVLAFLSTPKPNPY